MSSLPKPQHIGLVLNDYSQYSETFLRLKISGLLDSGFHVTVFCRAALHLPRHPGLRFVFTAPLNPTRLRLAVHWFRNALLALGHPRRLWRYWQGFKIQGLPVKARLKRLGLDAPFFRAGSLDWLHFSFLALAIDRPSLAEALGARFSASIRGYDIALTPLKQPGCYDRVWPRLTKLHSISDDLTALARQQGLPASVPVVKITPAIEVARFLTLRHAFAPGSCARFLTTGRLNWKKGLVFALKAASLLKERGLAFTWTFAGEGPQRDELHFLTQVYHLQDHVHWRGRLSAQEIDEALKQADVYVQPSIQEGFCNAVLEAQAAGLPCVVSDAEGLPENVDEGRCGWIVPKADPLALADSLQGLVSAEPAEVESVIQRARRRIEARFTLELQQAAWAAFFTR
jgi:colanic acid/amylovoran biosynthesis glycosyltransferase